MKGKSSSFRVKMLMPATFCIAMRKLYFLSHFKSLLAITKWLQLLGTLRSIGMSSSHVSYWITNSNSSASKNVRTNDDPWLGSVVFVQSQCTIMLSLSCLKNNFRSGSENSHNDITIRFDKLLVNVNKWNGNRIFTLN